MLGLGFRDSRFWAKDVDKESKYGAVPILKGTYLGPIKRILVFWGLYWGPPISGNYNVYSATPFFRGDLLNRSRTIRRLVKRSGLSGGKGELTCFNPEV